MKAILATFGSYGDVKPFIGMAKELLRDGHDALLIANPHFREAIESEGIPFRPAGTEEDYLAAATPAIATGNRFHDQGEQIAASRRLFTCMFMNPTRETYDIISECRNEASVVIGHFYAYGARLAAEKHALPYVNAVLSPYWLKGFVKPGGPAAFFQRLGAASTTRFIDGQLFTRPMGELRANFGMDPLRQGSMRWMFSAHNLCLMPDWLVDFKLEPGLDATFTGFPQGAEEGDLPPRVSDFLSRHPSPVVFTPGSAVTQARAFFAAALPALQKLGIPGIFLTRAAESLPAELPDTVLHADYVPLELLLGSASALVHHGGIGTAARALEAGTPQLICPRMAEQTENARALTRLGVADTLPFAEVSAETMAAKLEKLLGDASVRTHCAEIAQWQLNMPERCLADYLGGVIGR